MEDESIIIQPQTNTKIVKVQVDKGTDIVVEARILPGEADVSDKLQQFDKVTGAIERVAAAMTKAWEKAGPSRASVEFNLEFAWSAGELLAMFVQGSSTASLKITLEWGDIQS
jgi:hypothetical protein